MLFTNFASWEKSHYVFPKLFHRTAHSAVLCTLCTVKPKRCTTERTNPSDLQDGSCGGKSEKRLYMSHWCRHGNLALLHAKLFPTLWHRTGLGLHREARCAPRMHACRVPISEYTVIGLPEDPYLTFRLQVAGHFSAQPSSASAINSFVAQPSHHNRKADRLWKTSMLI